MIVKIKPPTGAMSTAIAYNERKVNAGTAHVVARMNMDSDDRMAVRDTFARYERLNIRSREVCFHMSVNPGPDEGLDDGLASDLIQGIMKELGYESQPYVIYRHNDIEREHFHVLSIRTNEQGRKISSFQEKNRCRRFLESVKEQYGFTLGNKATERLEQEGINPRLFNHEAGNVSVQMEAVFEECIKYHFTTFEQFRQIMRDHNVSVKNTGRRLSLQGLDCDGNRCTSPVPKQDMMSRMLDRMQESMEEDKGKNARRVALLGAALLPYSQSERHFVNMMLRKHIHAAFGRSLSGQINSAMYIDHEGRCALGAEDLGHGLSLAMIQEADKSQWENQESHHPGISVGTFLFSAGGNSKGLERDPKYRKKQSKIHHP